MKKFTCDICGRVIEEETEDEIVQRVQHHMKVDHGMTDMTDVQSPNIAGEEDEIKERTEEV